MGPRCARCNEARRDDHRNDASLMIGAMEPDWVLKSVKVLLCEIGKTSRYSKAVRATISIRRNNRRGMAMEGYFRMCRCEDPGEVEDVRQGLLEYCRMDTLGMVRLYEKLMKMGF